MILLLPLLLQSSTFLILHSTKIDIFNSQICTSASIFRCGLFYIIFCYVYTFISIDKFIFKFNRLTIPWICSSFDTQCCFYPIFNVLEIMASMRSRFKICAKFTLLTSATSVLLYCASRYMDALHFLRAMNKWEW